MLTNELPNGLKQKFTEVAGSSKQLEPQITYSSTENVYDTGKLLLWKGMETNYFWMAGGSPGTISIYQYKADTENAVIYMEYNFGPTAIIVDAVYFPLAEDCPGVIVALADRAMDKHGDYLAYISLRSRKMLQAMYMNYKITCVHTILDGTAQKSDFLKLNSSFHNDWPHIILVGCRYGSASLTHMNLTAEDDRVTHFTTCTTSEMRQNDAYTPNQRPVPVKPKKNIHLSRIFYDDEMFVFRSDDNVTKCHPKEKVYVSALYYIEKSGLAVIGFNFGGIMFVSLRTSKVFSIIYLEGVIENFALQEPEEDPRPILFFWIAIRQGSKQAPKGSSLVLITINFPKDEEAYKNPIDYTYLDPVFTPSMKRNLEPCSKLVTMRTILTKDNATSAIDSSLLFICWIEKTTSQTTVHGSLFDLNSFYAKRLIGRIQPDSTIAKQLPFFSYFTSTQESLNETSFVLLDAIPDKVSRFATPAFVKETIDQLYYPSTFYNSIVCLTTKRIFHAKVQPIQLQLIIDLAQNVTTYFNEPNEPCKWIHAIGLANSLPSENQNEQRACLLRVLLYNSFPAVITLIESIASVPESLKFVQKWVWKEVELTKTKFDDLSSPLFEAPPLELSPSARNFIMQAKEFFRRASLVFEVLSKKILKLDQTVHNEWIKSLIVQHKAARHVSLYSAGITFSLTYGLLPVNQLNSKFYCAAVKHFQTRQDKMADKGKKSKIYGLVQEMMDLNPSEPVWQKQKAEEWYPPSDLASFLPILLLVNVTEMAKLTLIGYYLLDFDESVAETQELKELTLPGANDSKLFEKCCSFLMREDFSLPAMKKIRKFWWDDKMQQFTIEEKSSSIQPTNEGSRQLLAEQDKEKELKWLPLDNPEEIKHCLDEYSKLKWGLYKYNQNIIEKRRYPLLLELPPLTGREPDFVTRCHGECLEIRRKFPALFKKIEGLPQYIIDKYRENCARNDTSKSNSILTTSYSPDIFKKIEQQQLSLKLDIRPANRIESQQSGSHLASITNQQIKLPIKRPLSMLGPGKPLTAESMGIGFQSEESLQLEEMPLTFATPKKRPRLTRIFDTENEILSDSNSLVASPQRTRLFRFGEESEMEGNGDGSEKINPSVECKVIDKSVMRKKDWEQINRLAQTPVSLRKHVSRIPIRTQKEKSIPEPMMIEITTQTHVLVVQQELGTPTGVPSVSTPVPDSLTHYTDDEEKGMKTPERIVPPPPPTSILKSADRTKTRMVSDSTGRKPKLRFAHVLHTLEQIPSRAERALDADSSFTSFAILSSSESSASALHSSTTTDSRSHSSRSAPPSTDAQKNALPSIDRIADIPLIRYDDDDDEGHNEGHAMTDGCCQSEKESTPDKNNDKKENKQSIENPPDNSRKEILRRSPRLARRSPKK